MAYFFDKPNPVYEVIAGQSDCEHPFVDLTHLMDEGATMQWECRVCGRVVRQKLMIFEKHTMPEVWPK